MKAGRMAKKKKKKTIAARIEKAAGDVTDAVSVAATGFPAGVLELAAEEELTGEPVRRRRKKVVPRRSKRPAQKGRTPARR
jgi:hypothetical protein